jgi:hypothetical protein
MPLMEQFAAVANAEVAHLVFDAARIESPATADASAARDLVEQHIAPSSQPLRGEQPQLAASCA